MSATVSKCVLGLIYGYHKFSKICVLYIFCRPSLKTGEMWYSPNSPFIFTNVLSISKCFHRKIKDVWTYLFKIIYLNITNTFQVNSNNLTGDAILQHAGFWILPLLILLKLCLRIFSKDLLSTKPFSATLDAVPSF